MGTDVLACPGVSANRMIAGTTGGTIGAWLIPPPAPPVPDLSPLEAVNEATDNDTDALVSLAILFEVL